MRNYLILNGINSNTINGLLISTLPPISKPLIRTNVEEIDGRDGDIVTTLGYSAYDKQFDIGLYGNYDINEIISYFNSKGTVVFSNEPDKYYNYQILEQIDFEKLIRFKTATVTMHIQPFKYLVDEQPIVENATEISDEGKNITLNNTNDGFLFNDFKVKGNTEQATRSGKNLFKPNNSLSNNIVSINNNGEIILNGTVSSAIFLGNIGSIALKAGTYKGHIEISGEINGSYMYFYNESEQQIVFNKSNLQQNLSVESELNQNIRLVVVEGTYNNVVIKFQIEEGSTATTYEPYGASPSPDYPSPVNNVTGDVKVKVQNGNLAWNGWAEDFVSRINDTNVATKETYENRNCLKYGASAGYRDYDNKYIFKTNWKENTQYVISYYAKSTQGYLNLSIEYTDGTTSSIDGTPITDWTKVILTSTANKTIKYVRARYVGGATYIDLDTFMVVEGTTAGDYTPHAEQNYPISLGDIELCKIGEYQDYIYKENGNWYKYSQIARVTLDENSNWGSLSLNTQGLGLITCNTNNVYKGGSSLGLSNYFKYSYSINSPTPCFFNYADGYQRLGFVVSFTTKADFLSWVSTHNIIAYSVLKTPITTQITDTTLINQLNALEQAYSYDDITHIISDGNLAPIVLAKINTIENEQTITNEGNYFSKPKITIYGKGTIGININGLQVLSIELNSDETDHITIDSSIMEAYTDNLNTLRNRAVTGDYNNLKLNPGNNNLSFSGMVENYTIENYTRWL